MQVDVLSGGAVTSIGQTTNEISYLVFGFSIIAFILAFLEKNNILSEEFAPALYMLLLGVIVGWWLPRLNQGIGNIIILSILVIILCVLAYNSYQKKQIQTLYDRNYLYYKLSNE